MPELTSPGAAGATAFREALLQQAQLQRQAMLDAIDKQKTQEQLALTAQQRATQKEAADALAAQRKETTNAATISEAERTHQLGSPLAAPEAASMLATPALAPLVTPAPAPDLQQTMAAQLPPEATTDASNNSVVVPQPTATFKGTEKQRTDLATRTKLQDIADGHFDLPDGVDPHVKAAMMVDAHLRLAGMAPLTAGVITPKTAAETTAEMDNAAQHLYTKRAAHVADPTQPALTVAENSALTGYESRKGATATAALPGKEAMAADSRRDNAIKTALGEITKTNETLMDKVTRTDTLLNTLDVPGGVSDAVAAPEFLSVMAGGFGTGLRMSEAELRRINVAQGKWALLKAWISAWNPDSPDPTKQKEFYPLMLQPAAREEMTRLATYMLSRAHGQVELFAEYRDKITDAKTAEEARHLKNELDAKRLAFASQLNGPTPPATVPGPAVAVPITPARPAFDPKKLGG